MDMASNHQTLPPPILNQHVTSTILVPSHKKQTTQWIQQWIQLDHLSQLTALVHPQGMASGLEDLEVEHEDHEENEENEETRHLHMRLLRSLEIS